MAMARQVAGENFSSVLADYGHRMALPHSTLAERFLPLLSSTLTPPHERLQYPGTRAV